MKLSDLFLLKKSWPSGIASSKYYFCKDRNVTIHSTFKKKKESMRSEVVLRTHRVGNFFWNYSLDEPIFYNDQYSTFLNLLSEIKIIKNFSYSLCDLKADSY